MLVKDAKALARQWVTEEASTIPGSGARGAFFHGSVNWLPGDAPLTATSDIDVMIVLGDAEPPDKPGKFRYQEVLLEISYISSDRLRSPEQILGQYDLAGSFHGSSIIWDPSGELTELQAAVANDYAKRHWVHRRCEDASERVLRNLASLDKSKPWYDQVTAWLFATGVLTHVLLVAGLKNPTVRRRYVAVRELLEYYGHPEAYETLLELLGCAQMSRERAADHLAALTGAFDAATTVARTPFFFSPDITDIARPIAIDGSRELIAHGDHREAVFWMAATYSRCQKVLHHDAPAELQERFSPGYEKLLGDLGIISPADIRLRGEQVREFLPRVWDVADAIVAANPDIVDEPPTGVSD